MSNKHVIKPVIRNSLLAILPAFIIFIVFVYYPLANTIFYSFTDWNGFSKHFNIVYLNNFIEMFEDDSTYKAFSNTIYLSVITIIIGTLVQLSLALMLDSKTRGDNFFKVIFYIPCIISPIIVGLTWNAFFQYNGIINEFLGRIHMTYLVKDWLGNPHIVKNSLIFINTWQWAGYGMVIFLAGLSSVPKEVYEAAELDGATGFKKFIKITLPLIMPSMTIVMFLGITGALKMFDLPYTLTNGGPMEASTTITMAIYNNAFQDQRFGYASAIGLVFFIFIASITITQLKITRKQEVEY